MDVNQHYAALLGLGDEWTVTNVVLDVPGKRVDVYVEYAQKSAICPVCGELAGLHDRLEERSWRHLDTMQFITEIHARTPRVSCPRHGVKVIELPWASKSSRFTLLFEAFAVDVLKAAKSIKDAQGILRLSWHQTQQIMAAAVRRGMARRDADEVSFIGMDEKSFRHGKKADDFACVMTDIDGRRILDVGRGRSEEGARQLIERALNPVQRHLVCGAAIDMSAPFEKAIRELLPCADVVFDKFHVEKHLNEGVDNTRKQENGRMLKRHLYGLLAWFGCMIDNALTEGFNATIQSLKASARGYRNFENFRTVILFFCGKLDLRPDFVRIGSTI